MVLGLLELHAYRDFMLFFFQNMIFLNAIVKPCHDNLKSMHAALDADKPITKELLNSWIANAEVADAAINDRMFIVMTAQTKGWPFAKEVQFFKAGIVS